MNRQSCWRCVLENEYRYNSIRIAYSLILQSTTPYTPCSVLVHSPSFNGGVWWRRQSCSGSIDGFLPTAVHNTVHYVHYNWVCRVQSLFGFIDHIYEVSHMVYWYYDIGWKYFLFGALRLALYFVLCTPYIIPCIFGYWNGGWCSVFMQVGTRPSANSAHHRHKIKIKMIKIDKKKYPRLCCWVDQHLQVATKPLPQLTLSIELCLSTTNITRSSLASAVGQRRQCHWVQRFGSNGNPPSSSVHIPFHSTPEYTT